VIRPRPRAISTQSLAAVSGPRLSRYHLVRECMSRYISPITVDAVLGKALRASGLASASLADGRIDSVVEEAMIGLRMFVAPNKLPDLMVELAEILERTQH
jgi:hypothetical protein